LRGLRDLERTAKVLARIERLIGRAILVDRQSPVGAGVSELRINYGPGYAVLLLKRGTALIKSFGWRRQELTKPSTLMRPFCWQTPWRRT